VRVVIDTGRLRMRPHSWWLRSLAAVDRFVDYRSLVPLRIAAGFLVLMHLEPFLRAAARGVIYRDRFYVPYQSWIPELPRSWYVTALILAAIGAVLLSVGLFTRAASVTTAAIVIYNLALSRTHYHHNRAFLAVLLVGLALVPAGGAVSLDSWRAHRAGRAITTRARQWPLILLRFQIAAVYVASGVSKLLDPDWVGGVVTRLRVGSALEVPGSVVPGFLLDVAVDPLVHALVAPVIVLTEIFIGIGLLVRKTRVAAIWIAVVFHIAIEVSANVQVFSWAAIAALVVWVAPIGRERTVSIGSGRPSAEHEARAVRWLDWTGRFRVAVDSSGSRDVLLERAERPPEAGAAAILGVLRLLPATFLAAVPLSVWRRQAVQSGSVTNRRPA